MSEGWSGAVEGPGEWAMIGLRHDQPMDAIHLGRQFRAVRMSRGLRQQDLAIRAHVGHTLVSEIERGLIDGMTVGRLIAVATALELDLSIVARSRGANLDRLLAGGHALLQQHMAEVVRRAPGWTVEAEVTFSEWGERGAIDLLAWHVETRSLLVIEVKTEIVDPGAHARQIDVYRRLAPRIALGQGRRAATVSTWLVIAEGTSNRRRLEAAGSILRPAGTLDAAAMAQWLRHPHDAVRAVSFTAPGGAAPRTAPAQRIRRSRRA